MNSDWLRKNSKTNKQTNKQTKTKPDKIPAWNMDFVRFSTPRCRAIGNCQMLAEGETVLSKRIAPGKLIMFQWNTTYIRIFKQFKLVLVEKNVWVSK